MPVGISAGFQRRLARCLTRPMLLFTAEAGRKAQNVQSSENPHTKLAFRYVSEMVLVYIFVVPKCTRERGLSRESYSRVTSIFWFT